MGVGRLIVGVSRSHAIRHTPLVRILLTSDQLGAEAATYKTHNKQKKQISTHVAGFEPSITATEKAYKS